MGRWIALGATLCVLVLANANAQESKLAVDLARCREILRLRGPRAEFENTQEYESRLSAFESLLPELTDIESREYLIRLQLDVRRYDADGEYYPVEASKDDLLQPAYGEIPMPRAVARRAKSELTSALASVGIRTAYPWIRSASASAVGRQWQIEFQSAWTLAGRSEGPVLDIAMAAVDFAGSALVWGKQDGSVRVWDLERHDLQPLLLEYPYEGWSLAVDPTGLRVASAGGDVHIWELATRRIQATFTGAGGGAVRDLDYSPSGELLVSAAPDAIRVWDVGQRTLVTAYTEHAAKYAAPPTTRRSTVGTTRPPSSWTRNASSLVVSTTLVSGRRPAGARCMSSQDTRTTSCRSRTTTPTASWPQEAGATYRRSGPRTVAGYFCGT